LPSGYCAGALKRAGQGSNGTFFGIPRVLANKTDKSNLRTLKPALGIVQSSHPWDEKTAPFSKLSQDLVAVTNPAGQNFGKDFRRSVFHILDANCWRNFLAIGPRREVSPTFSIASDYDHSLSANQQINQMGDFGEKGDLGYEPNAGASVPLPKGLFGGSVLLPTGMKLLPEFPLLKNCPTLGTGILIDTKRRQTPMV